MTQVRPKLVFLVAVDWFFCSHFLARAIAAREAGYEVLVLTNVDRHGDVIRKSGLRLMHLPMRRRSLNPINALRSMFGILQVYRSERPDLVHHVAIKPILLGGLAARLSGSRKVVNAMVGGGYAFTSRSPLAKMLRPLLELGFKLFLNPPGSRAVFENADDLNSFIEAGLARKRDSVLIQGAGVDPVQFRPGSGSQGLPIVVLAARLLWDKGVAEFVDAVRVLKRRGVEARFVIVGEPDAENRASIDPATLQVWSTERVVELWGFRDDMPQILAQATIACLPSYREGLPKSLLEAMACGLPCVTTDVPGCREAVRDGDNGLLVPARDVSALADALEHLLCNPELARKMGVRGRQRLEQEFSVQQVNERTLALYREVLAQ